MTAPGHTPGSTIMVLSSGTARALLLGDVVHCPIELINDEWARLGDVDPELANARATRWREKSKAPTRRWRRPTFRGWCSVGCLRPTDNVAGWCSAMGQA